MIKILDSTKSLTSLASDTSNGLGQFEAISCLVTEELNGVYECEITMLATDKHFSELSVGGILQIPVNESGSLQMFRIYYIGKPINEVVEIKLQHITYDLSKTAVKPFTATGAVNAKNGMLSNTLGTNPFTMTTDISNTSSKFTLDIPRSFRECLGGYEGSLLDVFRGEYEWDNLTVKMLAKRGTDNGVRIAYGKNLTDFKQEENIENVYTSVLGYAVVNEKTYTGNIYHKVSATYPKVKIVDFSSDYQNEQVPTTAQLTTKAQEYAQRNDIEVPNINLTISFVPLYQTEEYKDIAPLERVSLGDTVHIFFDKLNVEASARVIKTIWNVNLGRYDTIELGSAKANLNTVLNDVVEESKNGIVESQSFLESQLNDMATLIINGLGLHRTLVDTGDGAYRIYLHNKSTLAESDTQYIFTSEGFLVSTDFGKTWNAGFDSQGNAVLNSLATITLKALEIQGSIIRGTEIYGTSITFGDTNGKYVLASSNSTNSGVNFSGTGDIYLTTQGALDLINYYTDGKTVQNEIRMYNGSSTNNTYILNNKYASSSIGNRVNLSSTNTLNFLEILNKNYNTNDNANRLYLTSTATSNEFILQNGTSSVGYNSITSFANAAIKTIDIMNYLRNTGNVENQIQLSSKSDRNEISLNNYNVSGNINNSMLISSISSKNNQITFYNYDYSDTKQYANALFMQSHSGGNSLVMYNYANGSIRNQLIFDSVGNVTLSASNKLVLTINGIDAELYLENGYIRYR